MNTLEVEKDFISMLPPEIIEIIMNNLSETKDIISFALTCKYTMDMISRVRQNIVVTDENIIKELLQTVEGRRVVCKLVCDVNGKDGGGKEHSFLFYDESGRYRKFVPFFEFHCPGVAIKIQSAAEQHHLFQEILDKCPRIDEIMIKDYSVEKECLIDFNNFQICGLPKKGCISEKDIKILSTKVPKLRNLILFRSIKDTRLNYANIQVIAPNGLFKGWSVNFELSNGDYYEEIDDDYTSTGSGTDEKFERLIVNWESITKFSINAGYGSLLTDRSIKLLSSTNTGLESIYLRTHNLTGDSLDDLGLHCKNLNSIDLNINENITESSIKNLLRSKNIKSFRVWGEDGDVLVGRSGTGHIWDQIPEEGMRRILPLLKDVEEFSMISDYLVTDYVIESLANNCQNIQELTLNGFQLTGTGLLRVLRATGSSLKYLNLEGCDGLTSNDMMSIPNFCASLEKLDFGSDYMDRRKYSRKCLDYLQSKIKMIKFFYINSQNQMRYYDFSENSSDA